MKKNMGLADRITRMVIAVIAAILYMTDIITGTPGMVLLFLSAVLVLTSMASFCPLYLPLGLRTVKKTE